MSKHGFEKVRHSDKCLYGPRKLLLCGYAQEVQPKFRALLQMLGIDNLPLVWIAAEHADKSLNELIELPDGWGLSQASSLPRAIIVSGISENELHLLMSGCRKAGMGQALWAALTPTSIQWPLHKLLMQLSAEHKAMSSKNAPGHPPTEAG